MARIEAAAAHIFDEVGYEATTTSDVARAAGVSIGSLYQYFPNKDVLLGALAETHVAEASHALETLLADLATREPAADEVVRLLVEVAVATNDSQGLHAVLYQQAPRIPELRERLATLTDMLCREVARHLRRFGTGGPDPLRRAGIVVAACDAAIHEVVLRCARGPERDAAVDDLVDVLLRGVGAI